MSPASCHNSDDDKQTRYFRTPLHGSLEMGDESMSNLLLKAGASRDAQIS